MSRAAPPRASGHDDVQYEAGRSGPSQRPQARVGGPCGVCDKSEGLVYVGTNDPVQGVQIECAGLRR